MKVPLQLIILIPFVELVENTKDYKQIRRTPEWQQFRQAWSFWCYNSDFTKWDYVQLWWDLVELVEAELFTKSRQNDLYRRVLYLRGDLKRIGLL